MSEYIITPQEEPGWRFDPQDFLRRVQDRWPNACTGINSQPDDPMPAEALIPFDPPQRELGIALSKNHYSLYLDPADPETTAVFVAWYITQIPDFEPEIYLFTTDFDVNLSLQPDTRADDILAFLQ